MSPERHPLSWPFGWPRTLARSRKRAAFSTRTREAGKAWTTSRELTVYAALRRLTDELDRLRASSALISSNLPLRADGMPRSDAREPVDQGVAVYFKHRGVDRVFACDRWDRVADNVAAIAAHIAALRGIERWGVGSIDQAFRGYEALPPPEAPRSRPWRDVLDWPAGWDVTEVNVNDQWRKLARSRHPDSGGSHDLMAELNAAREAAISEVRR